MEVRGVVRIGKQAAVVVKEEGRKEGLMQCCVAYIESRKWGKRDEEITCG